MWDISRWSKKSFFEIFFLQTILDFHSLRNSYNTNSEKFTQIQNWWSRQFMSIATCRGSIKRQKFLIQAKFFCSFSLNVAVKFINKLQRHKPSWLYVFCEATRRFQNTWMLKNHKFGLKMLTHGLLCRIEWSIYIFVSIFLFER